MFASRCLICAGAAFAFFISNSSAFAFEQDQRKREQARPAAAETDLLPAATLTKLKLTKEQQEKFDKLSQEFKTKGKDIQTKLEAAKNDKDRAKYREATEEQQKLRPEYIGRVKAFLEEAQKKSLEVIRGETPRVRPADAGRPAARGVGSILPVPFQERLNLTADQKKKLDELQKEVDAKLQGLLTEEQRKLLERAGGTTPRKPDGAGQPRPRAKPADGAQAAPRNEAENAAASGRRKSPRTK